jgi:hypothetical protein
VQHVFARLVELWGTPLPPCPYCRYTAWSVDPKPVILPRIGPGEDGIPAFLVWCSHCGQEIPISAQILGLYDVAIRLHFGVPEGDGEAPGTDATTQEK